MTTKMVPPCRRFSPDVLFRRSAGTVTVAGPRRPLTGAARPEAAIEKEHMFVHDRGVYLAGLPVREELVLELARRVDDPTLAERLDDAYGRMVRVLALTIPERETIIRALDDP